jgi:hypothetical protein
VDYRIFKTRGITVAEGIKGKQGFQKTFDAGDILTVMSPCEELRTVTIQKRLSEDIRLTSKKRKQYKSVSKDWVRMSLIKLSEIGVVEKVKKEDDIADYWKVKEDVE